MLENYFKIAIRNIFKYKGYSFINITGLAIGLAASIFILLWVQDELNYDKFHANVENIYRIEHDQFYSGEKYHVNVTPYPVGPVYKELLPEVTNACRRSWMSDILFQYREKSITQQNIITADPSLFEMFDFNILARSTNELLVDPHSLVLTEETAEKYFGKENPIGKVLTLNKEFDFTVAGVCEKPPHNSTITFDVVIAFEFLREIGRWDDFWGSNSVTTYLEIEPNAHVPSINEKLTAILRENHKESTNNYMLAPFGDIHLFSYSGYGKETQDIQYVYIFSLIALFVLLIACINFMNLSTAKSANRAKEIGLRKVTGANRLGLIIQFFGESLLLTAIGTALALFIVSVLLPMFNNLTTKELPREILYSPEIVIGLIAITIITGFISGIYPSLYLSSFQPAKVLRGSLKSGAGSSTFRRVLVVLQFFLSIFLIVGTVIVYSQLEYMQTKNLGYDKEHLVYSYLPRDVRPKYELLKTEIGRLTNVLGVSGSDTRPNFIGRNTGDVKWENKDPEIKALVSIQSVDFNYLQSTGIELLEGRDFIPEFQGDLATDSTVNFIVNEELVKLMNKESAIGEQISTLGRTGQIVGVVKNYHFRSVKDKIAPLLFMLNPARAYYITARIAPNTVPQTLSEIESVWNELMPDNPFEFQFVDQDFEWIYRNEQRMVDLLKYFAIMAVIIAGLGLFGLSSFTAEQRTKEIGIRKVLGASEPKLIYLLCKEFLLLVAVSSLIAWPVGYYVMNGWLEGFAYRFDLGVSIFLLSGLLAVVISLLTVSYQAIKAAIANPIKSLRYE